MMMKASGFMIYISHGVESREQRLQNPSSLETGVEAAIRSNRSRVNKRQVICP
jgi:hypothetical protein